MPQAEVHVSPDIYARTLKECLEAFKIGNAQHARTLAMCAGVDAGVLGIPVNECPFNKPTPGFLDLHLEWIWGHGKGRSTNDNNRTMGALL